MIESHYLSRIRHYSRVEANSPLLGGEPKASDDLATFRLYVERGTSPCKSASLRIGSYLGSAFFTLTAMNAASSTVPVMMPDLRLRSHGNPTKYIPATFETPLR